MPTGEPSTSASAHAECLPTIGQMFAHHRVYFVFFDDYGDGPWGLTEKLGIGSEPPLAVPGSPRHPFRHDLYWGVQLASGHVIPPAEHGEGRDPRLDLPGSCLVKGPYPPDAKTLISRSHQGHRQKASTACGAGARAPNARQGRRQAADPRPRSDPPRPFRP